jgi:hypothetical protein
VGRRKRSIVAAAGAEVAADPILETRRKKKENIIIEVEILARGREAIEAEVKRVAVMKRRDKLVRREEQ